MKFMTEWRGEGGRKRPAEDIQNIQESPRKRSRDDNGRRQSTATATATAIETAIESPIVTDQEYRIRGSSNNTNKQSFPSSSQSPPNPTVSSPSTTEPPPAVSSIHPDRRANILNAAPDPAPAPLQNKRHHPPSQLSLSPEHINKAEPEEQRPHTAKPLHSASHPDLRIDTVRTSSSLDPRNPNYTPVMPAHTNEKSRDSPSHDSRKPPIDSSNPSSRRQSDGMPPPNATKINRSDTSTPKATSPPTHSELEPRRLPVTQPSAPLVQGLNGFAQSIMSAASLSVRRDLAKQQAVGQQRERDRQSKLKSAFLTLIEDVESRAEGVENVSTEIEKQINITSKNQSKIAMTLASELQKSEVPHASSSARDRGRFKEDLADLKADLKAAAKKIDYLDREAVMSDELQKKFRTLATRDELRGLLTKDELRRTTTDEVRKHVTEALMPTEKKLASLTVEDANLNQRIKGVEAVTHKTIEEKDQQQSSRFSRLDTSLNDMQTALGRLELIVQDQKQEYTAVKMDLGVQDKALTDLDTYVRRDLSDDEPSLETLVLRNSDQIQLLRQDCEELQTTTQQTKNLHVAPQIQSPPQTSKASVEAEDWHANLTLVRHDLDVMKADHEKVLLIRTDLDSLISEEKLKDVGVAEGFEDMERTLDKQREDLACLQSEVRLVKQSQATQTVQNHPPTPPFASASTSPRESDHQKLQDVELRLRNLTKTTQGLELFVNSQQQKFDRLTTDGVVQSMVHQMQQMYAQHPGNLVALVNQTVLRQSRVDTYLGGNLKDRLASIESQVAARATDSSIISNKIEEVSQFGAETRTILLAAVNSLKQDIEALREGALNERPQDPSSDHGNRIEELADRVTAVEARYVKAIGDFQNTQTDLIRNVKHMQCRNGLDSVRSTPVELTVMSRSSKSVEANGADVFLASSTHSDSSDTSLSQLANRSVRRDRKESRPPDPNLKRKAIDSDDEAENGNEIEDRGARTISAKKISKRRNVSGKIPLL